MNIADLDVVLAIPTRVKDIREEFKTTTGFPDKEGYFPMHHQSLGWFVLFEGSRERLFVGPVAPDNLHIGDSVMITVLKEKAK